MRGKMGRKFGFLFALVVSLLALPGLARAQGRVDLRYVFTEGETARSRLTIENTTRTAETASGATWEQRQRQEIVFSVLTTQVDGNGVGTVQMTIESIKATTDRSGEPRKEFDSTRPGQAGSGLGSAGQLADLVGKAITMVIEPDGAVREMRGVDLIARAMTAQLGEDPLAGAIVSGLTGSVADDALSEALQTPMRTLPGRPVRRGETWTTNFSQPLGALGEAKSKWKHRLASIERKPTGEDQVSQIAKIESTVDITLSQPQDKRKSRRDSPWTELQLGVKIRLGDATGSATTLFDVTRGRAIKSESCLNMPVDVLIDALAVSGDKSTMCQEIESLMTHELLPD